MTTFPGAPKLLKGGIALVDPASGRLLRVISLQYNPETLTRSMQIQAAGGEARNHSDALRFKGVPVETIRLEAHLDATDQLELPERNRSAVRVGLHPQIALLESLTYPRSAELLANDRLAASGTLEVLPIEAPLALFVWSRSRVVPVRPTELSVTEEAFDPALNPIRAKVTLALRVLSIDDLGFAHRGGTAYLGYLRLKESLAAGANPVPLAALGLEALP
jgi:hypothetical protein